MTSTRRILVAATMLALVTSATVATGSALASENPSPATVEFVYKGQVCYDHSYPRVASFKCDSGPSDSAGYITQAKCSNGAVVFGNYETYSSSYYSNAVCPVGTSVVQATPEPQYKFK